MNAGLLKVICLTSTELATLVSDSIIIPKGVVLQVTNPASGQPTFYFGMDDTLDDAFGVGSTATDSGSILLNNFAATSDPAATNDTSEGYSVGSRWINLTSNESWICCDATTDAADWQKTTVGTISEVAGLQTALDGKEAALGNPATTNKFLTSTTEGTRSWGFPSIAISDVTNLQDTLDDKENIYSITTSVYVNSSGNDSTGTGSFNNPYKTISHALSLSATNIFVGPGIYTEDITIPVAYGNYGPTLWAYNTHDSQRTEIVGTVTIPATVSRLRCYGIQFDGGGTVPCLVDNGSEGRHYFENCTFNNSGSADCVQINNGKRWHEFIRSVIDGKINLTGTGSSCTVNLKHTTGSSSCTATVNSGYTLGLLYVERMGIITHHAGNIVAEYVASWTPDGSGYIITSDSSSSSDIIYVAYSKFTADNITFGTINYTSATVIKDFNSEVTYNDACLSAVLLTSPLITTSEQVLIADTKKLERAVTYNTSTGELTIGRDGSYHIAIVLSIDCTISNKTVEVWAEKYNGATWDIVADTGITRTFGTTQEVELGYEFANYYRKGDIYRLKAKSDTDTGITLSTKTLTNGVKMPAMRISVND